MHAAAFQHTLPRKCTTANGLCNFACLPSVIQGTVFDADLVGLTALWVRPARVCVDCSVSALTGRACLLWADRSSTAHLLLGRTLSAKVAAGGSSVREGLALDQLQAEHQLLQIFTQRIILMSCNLAS